VRLYCETQTNPDWSHPDVRLCIHIGDVVRVDWHFLVDGEDEMKWILIVIWSSYYGHKGVTMQEFDTQRACQYAANSVGMKKALGTSTIKTECVQKGDGK
jgi:hypothetical protein